VEPYASWRSAARLCQALRRCNGCRACWLRCGAGAEVSEPEARVLLAYLRRAPVQERMRRLRRQNHAADLGDGVRVRLCPLFDVERRECAVYAVRPLVCRLLGHVEWMPCPAGRLRPVSSPQALGLLQRYARTRRRPIEEWLRLGGVLADADAGVTEGSVAGRWEEGV